MLAALALGACGARGTDEAADGPPDHVAEAVPDAIYEADGATACRLTTTEAQIDFANGDDCVAMIDQRSSRRPGADREELAGADFETSSRTTARRRSRPRSPTAETQRFHLVLQDGQWKIDSG